MKRVLILILAITTLAAARDKKPKAQPGPYVFTSKASAQTLKVLIVQTNLREGYILDSDDQFQFRFSKPAQMPVVECAFHGFKCVSGHDHQKGVVIHAGGTQWHDKGDRAAYLGISGRLLQNANSGVDMEPARGDCSISSNARQSSHFECADSDSDSCCSLAGSCSRFHSRLRSQISSRAPSNIRLVWNWRRIIRVSFASERRKGCDGLSPTSRQ